MVADGLVAPCHPDGAGQCSNRVPFFCYIRTKTNKRTSFGSTQPVQGGLKFDPSSAVNTFPPGVAGAEQKIQNGPVLLDAVQVSYFDLCPSRCTGSSSSSSNMCTRSPYTEQTRPVCGGDKMINK